MMDSYFWRMSPFKRLVWLKFFAGGGSSSILKTVTGTLLHITDALAKPAKKFVATLEPIQSGSGDPSPDNVRPITGHTGANVVRTGKNVYDKVNHPFESYSGRTDVCWTSPIFLKKGTYTFTCNDGFGRCYLNVYGTYNDAVNNVNRISQNSFTSDSSMTQTFTSDVYIRYQQNTVTGSFADVSNAWQTEIGSSASSYESPNITTIPITFPDAAGTVYGGTLTNEGGEWKLRVEYVKKTITSFTNTWGATTNPNGNAFYISDNDITHTTSDIDAEMMVSNIFRYSSENRNNAPLYNYGGNDGGANVITFILPSDITTLNEANTWLQNNPTECTFKLATPIDYTLSESQALTLLKGENVVWCDASDDLELQYYAKAEETP